MRLVFILVTSLSFALGAVGQVQQRGNGWLRMSQQFTRSDSYFDADSQPVSIRTNSLYATSLSGEYGLTERLTAFASFPFFVRTTINNLEFNQSGNANSGSSINSLGDSEIGVSFSFRKKLPVQVIGFITLGLPLGKKDRVGTDTDLQTGDGEFNQLVGIRLRQAFSSFHVSGYLAYNNRSENFSNEIRYGFNAGYKGGKFNLLVRFSAIESLFNDTAPVSLNSVFSNHREIFSPGTEIVYNFSRKIGVFASADFILAGRNTLKAPFFGAGIQVSKITN